MIKSTPVKVVREDLYCDKCGTKMISTGIALMSNPTQYPYTCPECHWDIRVFEQFPKITYINDDSN